MPFSPHSPRATAQVSQQRSSLLRFSLLSVAGLLVTACIAGGEDEKGKGGPGGTSAVFTDAIGEWIHDAPSGMEENQDDYWSRLELRADGTYDMEALDYDWAPGGAWLPDSGNAASGQGTWRCDSIEPEYCLLETSSPEGRMGQFFKFTRMGDSLHQESAGIFKGSSSGLFGKWESDRPSDWVAYPEPDIRNGFEIYPDSTLTFAGSTRAPQALAIEADTFTILENGSYQKVRYLIREKRLYAVLVLEHSTTYRRNP